MTSGITVDDKVKKLFDEMKVINREDDEKKRLRFATFIIQGDKITVGRCIREHELEEGGDHFKFFRTLLPDKDCCYALYDCHYQTTEYPVKEDLVFFMWAPDVACIKAKMRYASSKDALSKIFIGVKSIKQINDPGDYDVQHFSDHLGKDVISIEGKSLKCSQKKGH